MLPYKAATSEYRRETNTRSTSLLLCAATAGQNGWKKRSANGRVSSCFIKQRIWLLLLHRHWTTVAAMTTSVDMILFWRQPQRWSHRSLGVRRIKRTHTSLKKKEYKEIYKRERERERNWTIAARPLAYSTIISSTEKSWRIYNHQQQQGECVCVCLYSLFRWEPCWWMASSRSKKEREKNIYIIIPLYISTTLADFIFFFLLYIPTVCVCVLHPTRNRSRPNNNNNIFS